MGNNKSSISNIHYNGKLLKQLNISADNINNEAYLYKWFDSQYVVRKAGKQYNLPNERLVLLKKDICTYYAILKKYLPNNLPDTFFSKLDKKQGVILLITEYFPKGKITEVKNYSKKVKYFKAAYELLTKVINSKGNLNRDQLKYSIDPNPENFFINKQNDIIYNDFTPPLFYKKNNTWLEFRRKDELHTLKSEKEKRYFNQANLLFNYLNKARIFLPFLEYVNLIKWVHKQTSGSKTLVFSEILKELVHNPSVENCYKFKENVELRDLLRFLISLKKSFSKEEIKEIYNKSKKSDGVLYLKNLLNKY
jgi:hypothetical protein